MLWALAAVPLLVWGLVRAARRRRAAEARLADPHLFARLAPAPAPRWKRALPTGMYAAAVVVLLVAAARPVARVPMPVNRATVVLAIDTSRSMMADDVKPTRLETAQFAARRLLGALPRSIRVGLVAFSDVGAILVAPTADRRSFEDALARLEPQQSTAIGSAVLDALQILPGRREFLGERLARLRAQATPDPRGLPFPPPTQGPTPSGPPPSVEDLPPAAIVLFSDGVSNAGVDLRLAGALAAEARVRIHAVAIGQDGGAVTTFQGRPVLVPFDPTGLQGLAQQTGGEYLRVLDDESLRRIARHLGRTIGWERQRLEVTGLLAALAAVLTMLGAAASLVWFRRLP